MPRSSLALRAVPLAAIVAVAALAVVALRPDPRDVVLRVAAAGFVVGLGVAAILAVLVPLGWLAIVWRQTIGRRRTVARVIAFVVVVALTIVVLGLVVALYWMLQPAAAPAPEA